MPNIYDVASAIRPIRPDKAFAEGRQAAVDARRGTAYAGAIERQNQISDENAPLRDAQREQQTNKAQLDKAIDTIGAAEAIMSSINNEEELQQYLPELEKIAPKIAEKFTGD